MPNSVDLIPKRFANAPIKVPGSPFWNVFKRFGRDESIAMFINVLGTAIASFFFSTAWILSITGPIIEKIGFFPAHFKEAFDIYKTTPKEKRKGINYYFKKAIKNGSVSLLEDVLIHDPIYILLMFLGLTIYTGTPPWLLSAASFILAVFAVSGLEVTATEIRYKNYKRKLKKLGFGYEKYFESRFFISKEKKPKEVMENLMKQFELINLKKRNYHDLYLDNNLNQYSGRIPRLRLRKRTYSEKKELYPGNKEWLQTLQVIYTRAGEKGKRSLDQHRYFPICKEKLYYYLEGDMPQSLNEVKSSNAKKLFRSKEISKSIDFQRISANNSELLVSVDNIKENSLYYILELKVYEDVKLLMKAMRFVMREFPVVQTTHSKSDF